MIDFDSLDRLGRLRDAGHLTPEEFDREKARLLLDRTAHSTPDSHRLIVGNKLVGLVAGLTLLIGAIYFSVKSPSHRPSAATISRSIDANTLPTAALPQEETVDTSIVPDELRSACLTINQLGANVDLHKASMDEIMSTIIKRMDSVAWEASSNGYIMRASKDDRLTGKTDKMAIEFQRREVRATRYCGPAGFVPVRGVLNEQAIPNYTLGEIFWGAFQPYKGRA